jgi:hypothetical protein
MPNVLQLQKEEDQHPSGLPPDATGRFRAKKIANFPKTSIGTDAPQRVQLLAKQTLRSLNMRISGGLIGGPPRITSPLTRP